MVQTASKRLSESDTPSTAHAATGSAALKDACSQLLRGSEANYRVAGLFKAILSRADLTLANLRRANLSGAYLAWTNLRGANLSRVYLSEANLSEADLSGADHPRPYSSAVISRTPLCSSFPC